MIRNMSYKSFLVKVELTIQKISCPGIWLCQNGKVSLQLCMLDSNIQTESYNPLFPVIFNEKFVFYKTFLKERRLNELHRSLTREWFCAELIQWKNCDEGVVLASFQSTLDDLLYPSSFSSAKSDGTDVDLLLEPTKLFPGTLSPKLELRTKTTIEETFCKLNQRCSDKVSTGSMHKIACSKNNLSRLLHPKRVCHTVAYSKAQQRCPNPKSDKRPIFKYKRPEDDLILRTNPEKVVKDDVIRAKRYVESDIGDRLCRKKSSLKDTHSCYCGESIQLSGQENTNSHLVKTMKENLRRNNERVTEKCGCFSGKQHETYLCPVCSKYECTFSVVSSKPREFLPETISRKPSMKLCSYCQENYEQISNKCPCENRNTDSPSEKKVCFCLPQERTCRLTQRLHDRLVSTMQRGTASIENCLRNCEVCE